MKFKQICIFYSNLHKKNRRSIFLKRNSYTNSYTNLTQILTQILCDVIDNITYYFLISSINLKAVYLSFHWFNDSWTRGFELVTRGFELVTRGFELVTHGLELVTRGFDFVTRRLELVTRGFELVTRVFELVTRGLELVTHASISSCFFYQFCWNLLKHVKLIVNCESFFENIL